MRTALRDFILLISLIILLLIGIHGIITTLDLAWLNKYDPLPRLEDIPWISQLLTYTLILLLPLFVLALALEPKPTAPALITIKRKDGTVQVASSAIVKCVLATLSRIPNVLGGRCGVSETRQGILVKIRAYVQLGESLPQIDDAIKNKVRDLLNNNIGIEQIHDIRVVITDIKLEKDAAKRVSEFPRSKQSARSSS